MMSDRLAVTISEAARLVGVSRPTIYAWSKLEGFPIVRIGSTVRIPISAFERWLEAEAQTGRGDL